MKRENAITENASCPEGLSTLTYSELMEESFEPHLPIIRDLLYEGTYLFVGSPKIGKSFFMLQLAYHVSTGEPLWGTESLHLTVSAGTVKEGLVEQISSFLDTHPKTRLVLVDTLQKIRDDEGDSFSYKSDYEIIDKLKGISDKYKIGLIVVHHCRKMEAQDVFDQISGTNGLMGAADGAFVLTKKKRSDKKAELNIVGRDQASMLMYLHFDRERCIWGHEKHQMEMWSKQPDPLLELIADFFSNGKEEWTGTAQELMDILGYHGTSSNHVKKHLNVYAADLLLDYGIAYERMARKSHRKEFRLVRKFYPKEQDKDARLVETEDD